MKKWFFHKARNMEDQGDQKQLILLVNYTLSSIISFISLLSKQKKNIT